MKHLKNPRVILGLVVLIFIVFGSWGLVLGQRYDILLAKYPSINPTLFHYFLINLAPELAGIAIGVFSIDYLNNWRQDVELKRQLIMQLGSKHNEVVDTAARVLRSNGRDPENGDNWLTDGSLVGVYLTKANLSEIDLTKANLSETHFTSAKLIRTSFRGANLTGTDFLFTDLTKVSFHTADLSRAVFHEADLAGVNLFLAVLHEADLRGVDLTGAFLGGADLTGADLTGAFLGEADLRGADLTGSKVADSQLEKAILNENTTMPNGEKYKPSKEE